MAQATLPFLFAAATVLLGVLLAVCKIVICHLKNNHCNYRLYQEEQ